MNVFVKISTKLDILRPPVGKSVSDCRTAVRIFVLFALALQIVSV